MSPTFSNEEADLRVDVLLLAITLSGHQAKHGQEGPDVTQPLLLVLQRLLLRGLVDTGEHVGLGVTEHVEERLMLGMVPQHLGGMVTVSPSGHAAAGRQAEPRVWRSHSA